MRQRIALDTNLSSSSFSPLTLMSEIKLYPRTPGPFPPLTNSLVLFPIRTAFLDSLVTDPFSGLCQWKLAHRTDSYMLQTAHFLVRIFNEPILRAGSCNIILCPRYDMRTYYVNSHFTCSQAQYLFTALICCARYGGCSRTSDRSQNMLSLLGDQYLNHFRLGL